MEPTVGVTPDWGLTSASDEIIMEDARASRVIAASSERPDPIGAGMDGGEESPNSAGQCAR